MKDCGIEWIGEMPSDWEIRPLKYIFNVRNQKNNPVISEEILSLSIDKGVTLYAEKTTNKDRFKEDLTQYKLAYPNDIVMNSMNVIVGAVGISKYLGCVSPVYYVLFSSNQEKFLVEYYDYLFKTTTIRKVLFSLGKGIMSIEKGNDRVNTCRLKISMSDLGRMDFPVPPFIKQKLIVDFLDRKCAEIESLISLQQHMIDELKAYKQSVITETVCKGLDKSVPMKYCGIEWIGEVPVNWEIKKLKHLIKGNLVYGANESGVQFSEELPRYIRITDILDNSLREDINVLSLTEEQAKGFILEDNDIVFARSGGTVGKSFLYKSVYGRSAFAGYLIKATINESCNPNFIHFFTLSSSYAEWKNQIFIKSTIQNIGATKYAMLDIVVPPLTVQNELTEYLNKKCVEIDNLVTIKQQKIEELKEYQKTTIYEYITGKKEVQS